MENLMIQTLTQEIELLRGQLMLIEKQAEDLHATLDTLEERVDNLRQQPMQQEQEELPEIEVELIVDDDTEDDAKSENEAEAETEVEVTIEQTPEEPAIETVSEEPTENLLTEEEQELEDTVEDRIIEEIERESAAEKPAGVTLPPVDDIRKAISLGDRFLFQRELFGGDGEKMNKTIDKLNSMNSLDEAMAFISKKFEWNTESQAYELFINILRRRY